MLDASIFMRWVGTFLQVVKTAYCIYWASTVGTAVHFVNFPFHPSTKTNAQNPKHKKNQKAVQDKRQRHEFWMIPTLWNHHLSHYTSHELILGLWIDHSWQREPLNSTWVTVNRWNQSSGDCERAWGLRVAVHVGHFLSHSVWETLTFTIDDRALYYNQMCIIKS